MKGITYKGVKTKEISFPLGGIGTGCIGLAGNGRLIDWEIFNKPSKGSLNGLTHLLVKAESAKGVEDVRVLSGDIHPPYIGEYGRPKQGFFGSGPARGTLAGLPHFRDVEFTGEFPFCSIRFSDEQFPAKIELTAFNPLIPLNDFDSSIPAAFFEVEVENDRDYEINYTICFSLGNPFSRKESINTYASDEGISLIKLSSNSLKDTDIGFGDLTVATDACDVSYQEYWYRGGWFDNIEVFWKDMTSSQRLKNRSYPVPEDYVIEDTCSLAAHVSLGPWEKGKVRFIVSWNFPNCYNYWLPEETLAQGNDSEKKQQGSWKNYYATVFKDSMDSARYALKQWDSLNRQTLEFKNALFASTLPPEVLDAVSSNVAVLKSPTVMRLEDGSLFGFEGAAPEAGSCDGSCTHVWNYAYALPFLFPSLERSMRVLDYRYNQREDGFMCFRLQLPLGREHWKHRACVDGQFGSVIKAYGDWKVSGDTEWLKSIWGSMKKAIDFAWSETNEDKWDIDKDGVLEGRQHHTLDAELFGANSWLTGFYLAALRAGAEIADYLGEREKAEEYGRLFKMGSKWVDGNLFNGEYFSQKVDLKDKSVLDNFIDFDFDEEAGRTIQKVYWDEEHSEIKYQNSEGCFIDQVIAQWHANIYSLGRIFEKEKTLKSLESIYRYNFKKSMREHFNACRIFSLNNEAGAIMCEWPQGRNKGAVPIMYASETMTGFEYQVAAHMIQEGLTEEGLEIVRAVRNRYDGEKRNPWSEIECGSNYARSMASYSLLLAYSGFEFDMVEGMMGFNPRKLDDGEFRYFWSVGSGWGVFRTDANKTVIDILYGELNIRKLKLPFLKEKEIAVVLAEGKTVAFDMKNECLVLNATAKIGKGGTMEIISQGDRFLG